MKVIKRNQLVILVIALMLVTAGYLNFIEKQNENVVETSEEYYIADVGDATLVNSEPIAENEGTTLNESIVPNEEEVDNTKEAEDTKETSTNVESDEYFTETKLQRDTMYSQMLESYQKMLDSTAVSEEQKAIAQNEITKINETKNAIMIAENLIKTKGFKDVIILVNDASVNVIVNAEELQQADIAQVQNIISREMKAEIENIHISSK